MDRLEETADEALFDFITNREFKANLKADYVELQQSVKCGSWKAAHVLAGSIIESILVDHLVAVKFENRSEEKLLALGMKELISAGNKAGILTEKMTQLCAVVKDYRNLIHPGRIIRLKETVDENGAVVAHALVRMVAQEVGKRKAEIYGFTAEQLVTKIEKDHDCSAILPHFLKEMQDTEKERLVLEVLPAKTYTLYSGVPKDEIDDLENHRTRQVFGECFRLLREQATPELKTAILKHYISILKEQSAHYRMCYEENLFGLKDIVDGAYSKNAFKQQLHNSLSCSALAA